jgi:hypothetical protein
LSGDTYTGCTNSDEEDIKFFYLIDDQGLADSFGSGYNAIF